MCQSAIAFPVSAPWQDLESPRVVVPAHQAYSKKLGCSAWQVAETQVEVCTPYPYYDPPPLPLDTFQQYGWEGIPTGDTGVDKLPDSLVDQSDADQIQASQAK